MESNYELFYYYYKFISFLSTIASEKLVNILDLK